MSQELHYTSVPRGLKPGSRGFCTVGLTPHMPGPLVDRLEASAATSRFFLRTTRRRALNPIVFSHLRLTIGGKVVSVLSRIGPAGLDYSGRPNKYAHHVVLEGTERPEGGPAWLLSQPGFMQGAWEGEPREIPVGPDSAPGRSPARRGPRLASAHRRRRLGRRPGRVVPRRSATDGVPGVPARHGSLAALRRGAGSLARIAALGRRFQYVFQPASPGGELCLARRVGGIGRRQERAAAAQCACPRSLPRDGPCRGRLCSSTWRGPASGSSQEPGTTTAPPGSGRHIPRMPQEPAAPAADLPGQTGAPRARSTSGSYELVPELARLVSGTRVPGGVCGYDP